MFILTLQLVIFLFPLAYSPGPGNMFFAASGAKFGVLKTLPCSFGYHLATWFVTFVIGSGFYGTMKKYPNLLIFIGALGSFYVFYLAWQFIKSGEETGELHAQKIGIVSGALLLILNPKAYVIILVMFSQFLSEQQRLFDIIWITTVFTLNNFIAFFVWSYIGDRLLSNFRHKNHAKKLNLGFALVLFAVGIWLLISNVRPLL